MKKLISKSSEETKKIAQDFAKELRGGDAILLYGGLGEGKTTFVQGLAEGLGLKERIISPTFIIIREHRLYLKKNVNKFFHIDLYRLESESIEGMGFDEIFSDSSAIVAVEWAEKLGRLSPKKSWKVIMKTIFDNEREIEIDKNE
ncbi:MAG: tRNA (adenosine(37)-N6)-threonylcarbamoyltransferase complex ATPase subunit type 1 TsaE [Candidatus Levybacteria bacterium]|nr:tRNA (adenosine(37)-N6)-threonylcarbamoyltransferase complex ATPase subunit type 1 TsaE [Candidatus Levybacteria bacterium]